MMFEALKHGNHFPWDFQPLRDASEQYTRNHMSVTDRDLKSRFPHAPDIEGKRECADVQLPSPMTHCCTLPRASC